jgi:hypothetical protein
MLTSWWLLLLRYVRGYHIVVGLFVIYYICWDGYIVTFILLHLRYIHGITNRLLLLLLLCYNICYHL